MTLDEKIKKAYEVKVQIESLKEEFKNLNKEIKEAVDGTYDSPDGYSAKVTNRVNFEYNDEFSILNYIKSKGLSSNFLEEKIDKTKLNSELKNKGQLFNALQRYITESIDKSLTLSKK